MARRVVILFGAPGSGKTTLARQLVGPGAHRVGDWTMGASFAALGDLNQPVGGVDEVCARLGAGELETRYVVDQVRRLGPGVIAVFDHARFDVHEVTRELRGHAITAVYLRADPALCAERREQRGGNPRPITWYRGAGAREQAVAHTVGAPVIVDAAQPPASVAYQVRARV